MKAAFANIGIFADYADAPGAEFLVRSKPSFARVDAEAVHSIFDQLGVAPKGRFKVIPAVLLERNECRALINELDSQCGCDRDLKIPLTEEELAQLIGSALVEHLASFMPQGFNQIYLRRCSAHGKHIRFHVDEALWTMQVPLNDPEDYQGGRLVYATKDCRLACPHRAAGTATLHDSSTLHGVTQLESGVRYGLYFLQHPPGF